MEGTCDNCQAKLDQGGILFTPAGINQKAQNLCMTCFENMSKGDVQAEKAA